MLPLQGRTIFITGASRGIGRAIALKAAKAGANIVVLAKTTEPTSAMPDTIFTVQSEIEALGGKALAIACDIRDDTTIQRAAERAADVFGGIDVVINNASAIHFKATADTSLKQYDLMQDINARGTFATVKSCLPWLLKAEVPQIITMSPPINMRSQWLGMAPGYVVSKFGMSVLTLAFAAEFKGRIFANTLWPATPIATDAIRVNFPQLYSQSRTPEIMADAVIALLSGLPDGTPTGSHLIDEEILRQVGVSDFSGYAITPGATPARDIFID